MVKEVEEGEKRVVKPGVVGFDSRSELVCIQCQDAEVTMLSLNNISVHIYTSKTTLQLHLTLHSMMRQYTNTCNTQHTDTTHITAYMHTAHMIVVHLVTTVNKNVTAKSALSPILVQGYRVHSCKHVKEHCCSDKSLHGWTQLSLFDCSVCTKLQQFQQHCFNY